MYLKIRLEISSCTPK